MYSNEILHNFHTGILLAAMNLITIFNSKRICHFLEN